MEENNTLKYVPHLPDELTEAAKDGTLVLFIGALNVSIKSFL